MKKLLVLFGIIYTMTVCGQNNSDKKTLTTDDDLQQLANELLTGKQGSIVAIEPSTGEIKCMVSASYVDSTINRAISKEYSPASTFKTAQALTLLSEGIVTENKKYYCSEGFWDKNIHVGCHKHNPTLNLLGSISHSCNSYFCKGFMEMIDKRTQYKTKATAINTWYDYMRSMGLGAPLGIDLPGEQGGIMPNAHYLDSLHRNRWNAQTIMWVGMGQGEVKATPLQLCNLAASIANRGYYITPHIHQVKFTDNTYYKYTRRHVTMATAEAYDLLVKGMNGTMVNGTAKGRGLAGYETCGKTGTAENAGEDHSLFIGFAPMENPQIAVAVVIENGGFGADLAAPLASIIMERYLTGALTARTQHKVEQWKSFAVVPHEVNQALKDAEKDSSQIEIEKRTK